MFMHPSFGSPEEQQAEIDKQVAQVTDANHQVIEVMCELTLDQTRALKRVLTGIRDAGTLAPTVANYYVGFILASAKVRFGYCSVCDNTHDPLEELSKQGAQ